MEDKLFNKGFITITIINFIVYLVYYLMMVIIAVIAHNELHASFGQAGMASGIYIIGTLLARLIMGKELELIGRKRVARWGVYFLFNYYNCLLNNTNYRYLRYCSFIKRICVWNDINSIKCYCYRIYS